MLTWVRIGRSTLYRAPDSFDPLRLLVLLRMRLKPVENWDGCRQSPSKKWSVKWLMLILRHCGAGCERTLLTSLIEEGGTTLGARYFIFVIIISTLTACGKSEDAATSASSKTASAVKYEVPSDALPLAIDAIKGKWNVGPKVAAIRLEGDSIICINENGLSSKAVIKDGKAILATDWRVHAWLLANGNVLRWGDGGAWTR